LSRLTRHSKLNIYLKIHQIHKLQIGAGANILQGWLNADIEPIKDVMFLDAKKNSLLMIARLIISIVST